MGAGGDTLPRVTATQLATYTDGAVSCGTRLWRFRGHLQLTVVVKAVFTLVPDGVATPAGPGEIVVEDRHRDGHPFRSVEAASDLAPYLIRCDVLFIGHAHASGGPAAAGAVRLGVSRDGHRLLDKTIHVYGDRGPDGAPEPFTRMPIVYERAIGRTGAPNPVGSETPNLADPGDPQRPAGFGPISRLWPVRRHLIEGHDRKTFEGPIAEIPESMAWAYFQAAPPDQQLDPLRGGEWLVLDGLHPTRPRVQTRLPTVRGAARVELRGEALPAAVELVCDMLAIDGDRQTLTLSWRGRYEVAEGEAALPSLGVLAALETPGVPVDWARVRSMAAQGPLAAAAHLQVSADETVIMDPTQAPPVPPEAALPFWPSAAPPKPPSIHPAHPAHPAHPGHPTHATPWGAQPMLPARIASPGETTLELQPSPIPRGKKAGKTMALPIAQQELLASLPTMPFAQPAREQPPAPAPISGAPWSTVPMQPVPPPVPEAETAEMEPLDPGELFQPAVVSEPPRLPDPPVIVALRSEPPPARVAPSPAASPWKVEAPVVESAPPPTAPRVPQAPPVKNELYAGFRSKKR